MPAKICTSMRYCEKVLKKLIALTSHKNRRIEYDVVLSAFPPRSHIQLLNALETLEYLGCVELMRIYGNNEVKEMDVKVTSTGIAYFVTKKFKSSERWADRIIGFGIAVLLYIVTEKIIPLFI